MELSGWVMFLIVACAFIVPLVLGNVIARALKVKELGGRLGLVLLAISISLTPYLTQSIRGESFWDLFRVGIDLAGGTNLVYEVDSQAAKAAEKDITDSAMDQLVRAVGRRVNPSGTEDVTIRRIGGDRVEIIIPGADPDDVNATKRQITRLGSLEFCIVASPVVHSDLIARAQGKDEVRDGSVLRARWVPIAKLQDGSGDVKQTGISPAVTRTQQVGEETVTQALVVMELPKDRVDGRYLVSSRPVTDPDTGMPIVSFTFNTAGGRLFRKLTTTYGPKKDGTQFQLAVLLDGQIHSAPSINQPIGARGVIQGSFTNDEINELVGVLNAGALELPLRSEPISEFTISPLLGVDVQEKGKLAITISAILVVVFMFVYYLKAGFVANLCLVVNLLIVLGVMILIQATFTLPGLAGFVLTVGMAVDANVLIFERMREELARGSSTRLAIHNGFSKAFSTIVDANVTTLITAIILYYIGTDQVKGFAVTLFIGIVSSMFSVLFVGRVLFDLFEHQGFFPKINMLSIIGNTNIGFMQKRGMTTVLSIALIIAGLAAFISRGEDNLDIDFTGGSMVTFQFEDNPGIDETRATLQGEFGNSMSLERLEVANAAGGQDIFFRLRTNNQNIDEVRTKVDNAFASSTHALRKVSLEFEAPAEQMAEGDLTPTLQTEIRLSNEMSLPAIKDQILASYTGIYPEVPMTELGVLFTLEGTSGSGVEAAENAVKRFDAMNLVTDSSISAEQVTSALTALQKKMEDSPVFDEVNTFDKAVAGETQIDAIIAMVASLIAIVAYIWIRFQSVTFGLAAVVALVHDVLCVLGLTAIASMLSYTPVGPLFALTDFKLNLPIVAAFLTIVGYSLNDTIVVFDRIREVRGKSDKITQDMINESLNQTLSRTLLTSLTTLIVVVILYFFGGEGIHGFAFCLVVGIVVGTYSSIYVASPALLWLMNRSEKKSA